MFYEKLAASKQLDKKQLRDEENERIRGAGKGLAAGMLGIAAGKGIQAGSESLLNKGINSDKTNMENIIKSMGGKREPAAFVIFKKNKSQSRVGVPGDVYSLKTKDGRTLELALGAGKRKSDGAYYDASMRRVRNSGNRGLIRLDRGVMDEDLFFHELGHATGRGSKTRYQQPIGRLRAAMDHGAVKAVNRFGGLAAAGYAASARNKEEADQANAASNALLGLSALGKLPLLAEEARATIRAGKLKKKFTGRKLKYGKVLLPAYGTYVGSALADSAPAIAAKMISKWKQRQFTQPAKDK